MSDNRISTDMNLRVTDSRNSRAPVEATALYSTQDPYAVTFIFKISETESVRWLFARQLLLDGLTSPSGDGDVHLYPGGSGSGKVVVLELRSPSGHAFFELPATAVTEFLVASWALVPPGEESKFVDIEDELADFMTRESWRGV